MDQRSLPSPDNTVATPHGPTTKPERGAHITDAPVWVRAATVTLVADLPLVDHFDGGSVAYALLTTLWGTGAVVGSALARRTPRQLERRALVMGTAAMAVSLASLSVAPLRWA